MNKTFISKGFLLFLLVAVLYVCYQIFTPFLDEILISAVLVSIFYGPYERLVKLLRGRKNIASLVMCILVVLIVILPISNFIVYAAQRSVTGYNQIISSANNFNLEGLKNYPYLEKFNMIGIGTDTLKDVLIDVAKKLNDWLVGGAASLIRGTTSFFISIFLVLFAMFFFFVDGKKMVEKLMYWTPLPNKYDKEIFKKFKDVSYSTIFSTFITAIAQGFIGAIGLLIIGFPVFFTSIALAFASIIPYIGTAIVWVPISIYLLATGQIWQGIFLIVWGSVVVGNSDNLIRTYLIKDKAGVHPLFVFFSILGGIILFGFWGIVFGPLVISLAVTILHIYEMEYESVLEK